MYILIGLGVTLAIIIIFTVLFSLCKKIKKYQNGRNNRRDTEPMTTNTININSSLLPNRPASASAQVARQIELQNISNP